MGKEKFILVPHTHQIADTGDYDGCYEITNGDVSLFTNDDDDVVLERIVEALNDSDCRFFLDEADKIDNFLLKELLKDKEQEIKELKEKLKEQV